jgi:hypothetical protein
MFIVSQAVNSPVNDALRSRSNAMSERPPDRPVICSACELDLSEQEWDVACPACGGIARTYKIASTAEAADTEQK